MQIRGAIAALSIGLWLSAPARAQTGTLDQVSPWGFSWFNGDAPSLTWQQQVNVGLAGRLEGIALRVNGPPGASLNVRLRSGPGWNTSPVVFQTQLFKQLPDVEDLFVDVTSLNLVQAPGHEFVVEFQGTGTGCWILGTYVPPAQGPALYPAPLFLDIPGCYSACTSRIGFQTYVLTGPTPPAPPTPYCTSGMSASGCTSSITANDNPRVDYSAPCDVTVLGVDGQRPGILFYGLQQFIQPWCTQSISTSTMCVKAPTKRLNVANSGGTLGQCDGSIAVDWNDFQLANPGALGAPWTAGEKVYVQGWFRDPGSCKTTILSNALELTYLP